MMKASRSSASAGSTSDAEESLHGSISNAGDSASSMTVAGGSATDTRSSARDSDTLLPGEEMLELPPLPVRFFWKAEHLSTLPPGDQYVQPTSSSFEAIDSIAIVGDKAYLLQITQDTQHAINAGLLNILACLPEYLEVEFVWVLPPSIWASQTFNVRDVPQQPSPGSPAADRWDLVEERLRACQQQYKIPVQVGSDPPRSQPQPRVSLQCSSLFASRKTIKKTPAPAGLNLVRLPALALCFILPSLALPSANLRSWP